MYNANDNMTRIAIIGAGFAGLVCAKLLKQSGYNCTIFEKSRGVGGRMATRRNDAYSFDHGAQFFYVKTPQFNDFLTPLKKQGIIAPWHARFNEYNHTQLITKRQCIT